MGMTDRVNNNLKALFDTDNPQYQALVCNKNGTIPAVVTSPADIEIGVLASNLEWLRLVSLALLDQLYLDKASGAFLKYQLNEFFGSLRLEDETDAEWVQRTIATVFQPKVSRAAIIYALRPFSTAEPRIESGADYSGFADFSYCDAYNRAKFNVVYTKVNYYTRTQLDDMPKVVTELLQYIHYFYSDFGFADIQYPAEFYEVEKTTVFENGQSQYEVLSPIQEINSGIEISSMAYGNGVMIALSRTGIDRIKRSTDNGVTWTSIVSLENNEWNVIEYGNGIFMALAKSGINNVMTSADGLTWTLSSAPNSIPFSGLAYNNGVWIACARSGAKQLIRSTDNGLTWTEITTPADAHFTGISFGNNTFVAISETGVRKCMRSEDWGVTWQEVAILEQNKWQSICFGNGTFIAVSNNGSNRITYSTDNGITWQVSRAPALSNYNNIVFGGQSFIATADSGLARIIASTDNGIRWNGLDFTETYAWNYVTYNGTSFYITTETGQLAKLTNTFYNKVDTTQTVYVLPAIANREDSSYFSIRIILQNTPSSDVYTVLDIIDKVVAAGIAYTLVIENT